MTLSGDARGESYSPFHDFVEVAKWLWRREARFWRWMVICFGGGYAAIAVVLLIWDPEIPAALASEAGERPESAVDIFSAAVLSVASGVCLMAAVTFKARLIRLDRRLSAQHTAYYRARLERDFAEKEIRLLSDYAAWEREREEWKAEMQNQLYEQILEQVDRGVLGPRPKPRDDS